MADGRCSVDRSKAHLDWLCTVLYIDTGFPITTHFSGQRWSTESSSGHGVTASCRTVREYLGGFYTRNRIGRKMQSTTKHYILYNQERNVFLWCTGEKSYVRPSRLHELLLVQLELPDVVEDGEQRRQREHHGKHRHVPELENLFVSQSTTTGTRTPNNDYWY